MAHLGTDGDEEYDATRPARASERMVAEADPRNGEHRIRLLSSLAERYVRGEVAPEVYFAAVDCVARRTVEREIARAVARRHPPPGRGYGAR